MHIVFGRKMFLGELFEVILTESIKVLVKNYMNKCFTVECNILHKTLMKTQG